MHREQAARGLVEVHDAVCVDRVLVHQPAQLDEEPVRVGVLVLRAVELLQALGGASCSSSACSRLTHLSLGRTSGPSASSHSSTKPWIVTGLKHRQSSPAKRCFCRSAPFPATRSVQVDPVEHPGAKTLDLTQTSVYATSPFCPPLFQNVEEPVSHDGADLNFAAICRAAAGLVFNECSAWSGRGGRGGLGGTRSADVGDVLETEQSSDGVSSLPPTPVAVSGHHAGAMCF